MDNCKKKCSCNDQGLHTPCPLCQTLNCPEENPCPEIFSDQCIIHTGDGLPQLLIETGDSLANILQKLAMMFNSTQPCYYTSPIGLHSMIITSTSVSVGWTIQGTPLSFKVEYSLNMSTWVTLSPLLPAIITENITGLTANTVYYIKVLAEITTGVFCTSAIIKVKTNPS